jgi:hypothetical protein
LSSKISEKWKIIEEISLFILKWKVKRVFAPCKRFGKMLGEVE